MESLRWILLGAGIFFVLVIFLLGKSRRLRNRSLVDELEDDLPAFSAQNLDDLDEGVGEVRVITGSQANDEADNENLSSLNVSAGSVSASGTGTGADTGVETDAGGLEDTDEAAAPVAEPASESSSEPAADDNKPSGIIVLYILPKGDEVLAGSEINSSAQAMGLSFGDMNIFHYIHDGRNVFSLANMLEPGSFDADTIHELKTTGLTIFMQITGDDPLDDLTEMLQRSYQLAGLIGARLCNHKREPLTEQDAENYRTQVSTFSNAESKTLSEA